MMHDATDAGTRVAARALAYWRSVDSALCAAQSRQNRSRAYLLVRAVCRLTVTLAGAATMLASVYVAALFLLLTSA